MVRENFEFFKSTNQALSLKIFKLTRKRNGFAKRLRFLSKLFGLFANYFGLFANSQLFANYPVCKKLRIFSNRFELQSSEIFQVISLTESAREKD